LRAIIGQPIPCWLKRMSQQPFEIVSHTADIGMLVRGRDTGELLVHAAQALYSVLFYTTGFTQQLERIVVIDSLDGDTMLVDWLNELIYLFEAERLVFSRFQIEQITESGLRIRCLGECIDTGLHDVARDVKAATYHDVHISRTEDGCAARVIFDV